MQVKKMRTSYGIHLPIFFIMVLFMILSCDLNKEVGVSPNEPEARNKILTEIAPEGNFITFKGIGNAPTQSGAFVNRRSGIAFAITLVDAKSNLVATVGYPDRLPTYCGGDEPNDLVAIQDIIAANHEERIVNLVMGEMEVKVFEGPLNIYDFTQWCPFFTNAQLLAEGTAMVTSPTNDLQAIIDPQETDTKNRLIWGVQIQGKLLSPGDEIKHVSANVMYSWDKEEDFNTILDLVKSVSVQLH